MNNLSTKRKMKLIVVFKIDSSMTRELTRLHFSSNNDVSPSPYRRHLELCIFFKSSCWMFNGVPDPASVSFIVSVLALWPSEVHSLWFMSVSKRRWLICDSRRESREASDGREWHFMDHLSHALVWSICWAFLCMVSWQMERFIQRHIGFGAGTSNCRL